MAAVGRTQFGCAHLRVLVNGSYLAAWRMANQESLAEFGIVPRPGIGGREERSFAAAIRRA
jgi:hypothetical protein